MPPTIQDMLRRCTDYEQVRLLFDSAFGKGDNRDLRLLREFLIDLLFENREECLLKADNKAFVFTCLKLKHNWETEQVYEILADPEYTIALGYRDRKIFDSFLEGSNKKRLRDVTATEAEWVKREKEKVKIKREKYRHGKSKFEYWTISRATEWIDQMQEIIWPDFFSLYLALVPDRFDPSTTRTLLSLVFGKKACLVCGERLNRSQTKIYVAASETPLRRMEADDPDSVLLCQRCFLHCRENQVSPTDEVAAQNRFWDHRRDKTFFFKL